MTTNPSARKTSSQSDEMVTRSYDASLTVLKSVIPFLPDADGMGLKLMQQVKAIPMLIAAGNVPDASSGERKQSLGSASQFCRETVVMLSYCRDLHDRFINRSIVAELIDTYRSIGEGLSLELAGGKCSGGDLR